MCTRLSNKLTGLGAELSKLPLVHQAGECVKPDHLERVLRISGPHHRLKRQRHLLGRVVLAVSPHRAAHVDQHDGGAPGLILGLVHDVIFRAEPDRHASALADVGILHRLVKIQIRQRIAVDIGPRVFEDDASLAFLGRIVPAQRIAAEGLEQVFERLVLDLPHASRRHAPFALLILLDQAFLLDQLDDLGNLVLEIVHVLQDPVAVLQQDTRRAGRRPDRPIAAETPAIRPTWSTRRSPSSSACRMCRRPWPAC